LFPSISTNILYSYQVPIKILLFPSRSNQNFFCSNQVPIKILLFPCLWRIGR
jgi:hypothetical protein